MKRSLSPATGWERQMKDEARSKKRQKSVGILPDLPR